MDYLLIKGTYHVVGYSPDGDSLRFTADDPGLWDQLVPAGDPDQSVPGSGPGSAPGTGSGEDAFAKARLADDDVVQLRLQGIDAAETHFSPTSASPGITGPTTGSGAAVKGPVQFGQPGGLADAAADAVLSLLGVSDPVWRPAFSGRYLRSATVAGQGTVAVRGTDSIPGYILTRDLEAKGRPVAWAFTGPAPDADGAWTTVDALAALASTSLNYRLLARGLVYPYFFMTLQSKLRKKLARAVTSARAAASRSDAPNVWRSDRTTAGVPLTVIDAVLPGTDGGPDGELIHPYLFRKVLNHWYRTTPSTQGRSVDISTLCLRANPTVYLASDADFVKLDDVLELSGGVIRLTRPPHDLVFLE